MAGLGQFLKFTQPVVLCSGAFLIRPHSRKIQRCSGCVTCHRSIISQHIHSPIQYVPVQYYSTKRSFLGDMWDNIKQDMEKNKEMKENLQKFRKEAEKLEQSEALKKAREKYEAIESETAKGSQVLKEKLSAIQDRVKETMEEAEKSEYARKGREFVEDLGKTAEKVAKQGQQLKDTRVVKGVTEGVQTIKKEVDQVTLSRARMYQAPPKLRKRDESQMNRDSDKPVEADTESTGVVMHKDSIWYQSWQNFKDTNPIVTKMFDMKMKYDESDNIVVRATKALTDTVSNVFGGLFSKTELSEVVTEIVKMDPTFDKEKFLMDCQSDLIPNILEAMVHGDLEILKDWCYEGVFNTLSHPIKQAQQAGYKLQATVLDINHLDIAAGKMMEQGPVLVISFTAQQIMAVRNPAGTVIEGDPDKILKVFHVWAFCRDQSVLDPRAAWRLIDMSSSPAEQWL